MATYIKLQLIKDVISHPYGIAKVPKDMGQNPLRANVCTNEWSCHQFCLAWLDVCYLRLFAFPKRSGCQPYLILMSTIRMIHKIVVNVMWVISESTNTSNTYYMIHITVFRCNQNFELDKKQQNTFSWYQGYNVQTTDFCKPKLL